MTTAEQVVLSPEQARLAIDDVARQVGTVIVGQHDMVRSILVCLLCEGHALLEGVPGLGKTEVLKTLAQVVDLRFSRIQFTPDLMPADIVGTQVLTESADGGRDIRFRPGPVFANLVLADEVNRATPKTQSALLESMQERTATVAGATRPLPRPFFVMATQNPLEMEGTYPLPEAQLDRFLMKVLVPFPSRADLVQVVHRTTGAPPPPPERVLDTATMVALIELTRAVPIARPLVEEAVAMVVATHPDTDGAPRLVQEYVRFGASPRGAQAMVLAAKASALIDGRPNVSGDDLRMVAPAVLRHRMVLGYEAAADRVSADQILAEVVRSGPTAGRRPST